VKNVSEKAVRTVYESLRTRHAEFCACPRCQEDVLTLAMNHTRPRYVSGESTLGEVVTGVHLTYDQMRAELTVIVYDAMRRVAANPRHSS
jgi:competence protein ComFB